MFALVSLLCAAAAAPSDRLISLPGREGVPAHTVRLKTWKAEASGSAPLLLYEPGWNGSADENSVLLSTLAEDGFTVIALELAAGQPADFRFAAERLRLPMDLSSNDALHGTVQQAAWRVAVLAEDAVQSLAQIPEGHEAPGFGAIGYSFGGAVAAELCRRDPRFKACANMDGWLFGPAAEHPGPQPYLILSGDPYPEAPLPAARPTAMLDEWDAANLRARMQRMGGVYAEIAGLQHSDFTDARGGSAAVRSLIQAFFGETLLRRTSPVLESRHPFAGVTITRFPTPGPPP